MLVTDRVRRTLFTLSNLCLLPTALARCSSGGSSPSGAGGAADTTAIVGNRVATDDDAAADDPSGAEASASGPSAVLRGGASAAFICDPTATYGNPLEGMGAVEEFGPPSTGPFPFFEFIEGPVWIGSVAGGSLFFSDILEPQRIWQLVPPQTVPTLFLQNSGSNGLAIDGNDQLILADRAARRITRVDPVAGTITGEVVAATGTYRPNDLIVRSDGNLYFTDPNSGFYRVPTDGTLLGPQTQVGAPNGIVLSPDENTLYVGDFEASTVTTFSLASDGQVDAASARAFVATSGNRVDGMAVDCAGNLYVGTDAGVEVFDPSGAVVGTVPTGEASNCTFGGSDRRTLYVTSRSLLKSVRLAVPGLPD